MGRRWIFGKREFSNFFAPCIESTYTDAEARFSGTTRLPDALPDGSDKTVRFIGRVQNGDK